MLGGSFETVPWAWRMQGLTPTQKLVLMGLASYADENNSCYPGQDALAVNAGVSVRTIQRALDDLETFGLFYRERRYKDEGKRTSDRYYLNTKRRSPVNLSPEPYLTFDATLPDKKGDLTRHPCQGNNQINNQVEQPDNPIVPVDRFSDFYSVYPRKVGKQAAMKAWVKAIKIANPDAVIEGATRYANDPNLPTDKKFIPHPASWLNAGRWEDEPEPARGGQVIDAEALAIQRMQEIENGSFGGGSSGEVRSDGDAPQVEGH